MITLKLGELKEIVNGLNQIMGEKLPVKTAWAFTKLAKLIQKEVQMYEENRKKLIDTYCKKDEKGKPVINDGQYNIDDKESFGKEFTELSNIEIKIDFKPVSFNDLGDIKLSPVAMIALEKFVGD
jgi:hypothetical protein